MATTPWNDTRQSQERAHRLAQWFRCRPVERDGRSLARLFSEEAVDVVIVADRQPVLYSSSAPSSAVFFHPGMARQRILALQTGGIDRMARAADIRPGDRIVDATLGLGADALVAAVVAGPTGTVIALERSWFLARLFEHGLHASDEWYRGVSSWLPAHAPIAVHCVDHAVWLATAPVCSADVVLFDPMFRIRGKRVGSLDPLRPFTVPMATATSAWQDAKRVSRRSVVLKERPQSGEFQRLGVTADKRRTTTAYGVWRREEQ